MRWDDFSVYDYVDHLIFVLAPDADNRPVYRYLNKAGRERLGKQRDQIEGYPAHEIFGGRAAYSVYRRQCAAWDKAGPTEYEIALPIGTQTMWARTSLVPIRDADGTMIHMVGTSHDITAERDQLHAHVLSASSAQELEDMVCMAAHDLRSPLGNLKTLADMMRKDFVDHGDGKSQLIDLIDSISESALSVVASIMGQAMGHGTDDTCAAFDLGEMCDDIMVLLDPIGTHSVSYPRVKIEADRTVVHIILRNLIDNAIKYSGQPSVKISIDMGAMNAERLLFTVRDNGVGFEDKAFDMQRSAGGAGFGGFGLRGAARLVRARGGQLMLCRPQSGTGAEIKVELPGRVLHEQSGSDTALRAG